MSAVTYCGEGWRMPPFALLTPTCFWEVRLDHDSIVGEWVRDDHLHFLTRNVASGERTRLRKAHKNEFSSSVEVVLVVWLAPNFRIRYGLPLKHHRGLTANCDTDVAKALASHIAQPGDNVR